MANALALPSLEWRSASEIGRQTANPGDPEMTRLYEAAMAANPSNPYIDPARVAASIAARNQEIDQGYRTINGYKIPINQGGQTGMMGASAVSTPRVTAANYAPTAADYSDWGREIDARVGAQYNSIPMSEGGGMEPRGGLFSDPILGALFSAGLGFAGPAAAALGGISQSKNNPLGSLLALAGPTIGPQIWDKAKNALSGGFANPSALGLSGDNLSLPGLANAPGSSPVAGYGASGLGLSGANLGLNFASGAFPGVSVKGYGASAVGGDPNTLYPGGRKALDLPDLSGIPSAGGPALGGPAEAPRSAVTTRGPSGPSAPSTPQGQGFDPVLMAAGKMPANALMASGMGAGLIGRSARDLYRNPGYQPPPFANFLRA